MKDFNYYLNRIPTWIYEDKKSNDFFKVFGWFATDFNSACDEIINTMNIDKAVGSQLDFIGKLLDLTRNFPLNVEGYNGKLDDVHFRRLIKGKIVSRKFDGTIQGLKATLKTTFGTDLTFAIEDTEDLAYNVYVVGVENVSTDPNTYTPNPIDVALIEQGKYAPKPMGVKANYLVVENPIFAYNVENGTIFAGWNVGSWGREELKE